MNNNNYGKLELNTSQPFSPLLLATYRITSNEPSELLNTIKSSGIFYKIDLKGSKKGMIANLYQKPNEFGFRTSARPDGRMRASLRLQKNGWLGGFNKMHISADTEFFLKFLLHYGAVPQAFNKLTDHYNGVVRLSSVIPGSSTSLILQHKLIQNKNAFGNKTSVGVKQRLLGVGGEIISKKINPYDKRDYWIKLKWKPLALINSKGSHLNLKFSTEILGNGDDGYTFGAVGGYRFKPEYVIRDSEFNFFYKAIASSEKIQSSSKVWQKYQNRMQAQKFRYWWQTGAVFSYKQKELFANYNLNPFLKFQIDGFFGHSSRPSLELGLERKLSEWSRIRFGYEVISGLPFLSFVKEG